MLLAPACGSDSDSDSDSGDGTSTDTGDSGQMLAAAVEELITKDHTFGDGKPPSPII